MTVLSHYTSRAGLEGITQTKTLRATSFLQLNDPSEYFFAWREIMKGAMMLLVESLPPAQRPATFDPDQISALATQQFKTIIQNRNSGFMMYVTSFARSLTEDHTKRGILTIWDRYTQHEGYCLQFSEDDVRHMIYLESMRSNYAHIGLVNVTYGVDTETSEFKDLCYQVSQLWLVEALQTRSDLPRPTYQRMWAANYLYERILRFCARHKDPCYEDEREMRIIACPADIAVVRPFIGLAAVKQRRQTPDGRSYIALGEHWTPGISPQRIIIGTKADPDIATVLSNCSPRPEVAYANLPVA